MILYHNIVKDTDPILRKKSEDVGIPLSDEDLDSLYSMNEYLYNSYDQDFCKTHDIRPGVGIAGIQIGLLKKMLCILAYDEVGNFHNYCLINPKIISHSEEQTFLESGEGCLSVLKEHKGYIHRYKRVKVKTYIYNFDEKKLEQTTLMFKGYLAVVFQHEYDHLNGILFFDHINKTDPYYIPNNSKPIVFKMENEEENNK